MLNTQISLKWKYLILSTIDDEVTECKPFFDNYSYDEQLI
jgi:predicted molibdopterin-dependent oxidoreductase YjgC